MGVWTKVAVRADVKAGETIGRKIGDLHIAIYNVDGTFYATDGICTHAFSYLNDGWLVGTAIECPLHGGQFDVRSGKGLCSPITKDLRTYPVLVSGDDILVDVAGYGRPM